MFFNYFKYSSSVMETKLSHNLQTFSFLFTNNSRTFPKSPLKPKIEAINSLFALISQSSKDKVSFS